jgi:TPR repeat protein
MKKIFNKNLIGVAIITAISFNAYAEVNDFNTSYQTKDIEERYVENPYALFIRADKMMNEDNPDYVSALALFEKSSKLGIAEASHNAGFIYYNGLGGIEKNIKKAAAFFLISAESGIVESQMLLGNAFVSGEELKVNTEQAYKWFYRAAKQDVLEAKYYIANMIFFGKGTGMDTDLGLKILEEVAVETQNRKIFFEIGEIHRKGFNSPRNYTLALENHEKAAQLGFIESQRITADLYKYGRGAKHNNEKALYWYTKAALSNDTLSMANVADMHLYGQGTDKDVEEAEKWYHMGSEASNPHSLYQLASIYMKNQHGVEPDYTKAIGFYHKAVNVGHKEAIRELAIIYRKGVDDILDADHFKYTDLMNLYYKAAEETTENSFNMFVFKDDQDELKNQQALFNKTSFEKHLK